MSQFRPPKIVITDLRDFRKRMDKQKPFEAAVYETWFAQLYSGSHGVPCVSASLLDCIPNDFQAERVRIVSLASELHLDPLRILPTPSDFYIGVNGITFFLEGDILMMGTNSAIERAWRQVSHRFC